MIKQNNEKIKAKELKIVVIGSVGSGKTTSIHAISEIPVIGTEATASEKDALHRKKTTTVSMEYGIVHLDDIKIHLYGSPGQRRFDFMSDILLEGASGLIVMIDNGADNPLLELDYFLKRHGDFMLNNPVLIGITHYDDLRTQTGLLDFHRYTIDQGFSCPIVRLDAREKKDVARTIKRLLHEIFKEKKRQPIAKEVLSAPEELKTNNIGKYSESFNG